MAGRREEPSYKGRRPLELDRLFPARVRAKEGAAFAAAREFRLLEIS